MVGIQHLETVRYRNGFMGGLAASTNLYCISLYNMRSLKEILKS